MTDKEFKRLSRPQLIEIIYQLQLKLEELTQEAQAKKKEPEAASPRRFRSWSRGSHGVIG